MENKNKYKALKGMMQIAKVKFKYASQIFIPAYYVVTRTLKINLKLNIKFLDNNENLGKKK